ncbi:LysM peptidoglycan-binding domain-containing protein [Rhizobium sp. AAP43]|uniref:LysM peptidoglycan-binding domain-containing protein n=1 Tax=Rhizobium sp. AAP43 TaxID=1523420 RepID=UPI0006B93166|nr:LysM peptidoglycan-binding domain-containing protein [Rhizobium sp. AAP43]KPF41914.1 peptidoglycan-binding protein [Rhizobium sp. AAP43]
MKNRALWVVLFVLAIVSLLMVFVIMPRLHLSDSDAPTVTAETTPAATQPPATPSTETANQKMDRLKTEAVAAVDRMTALFDEGRTPGIEAYSAARTLAQGAVAALASLDIPTDLDAKLADAMRKVRADAAKALAMIEQLPADPARATAMIVAVKNALLGAPVEAVAPPEVSFAPRFDILRVEPDGSTVIAGNAPAGAKVEIISGDKVISSQTVDGTGDFAAVLDNPLAPGDHSLQIRATGTDGKVVTSEEIATISVPDKGKGELLAMVSKPGEASRLITLPGQEAAPTAPAADAAANPAGAAATTEAAANTMPAMPDLPAASSTLASAPPAMPGTTDGQTVAAAKPAEASSTSQPTTLAEVQVTAVEIEGRKIFVAGRAPAGAMVRGYADKAAIGETRSDTTGNFVIEGDIELSVGNHLIEVELLDANGRVLVRAAVPFDRPAGEQVSVVAPGTAAADASKGTPEEAGFERLRIALSKSMAILQNLYAGGQSPAMDQVAAARSSVEIALQSIAGLRVPADATDQFVLTAATHTAKAKDALKLLQSVPAGDVKAMGEALPKLASMLADLMQPDAPDTASQAPAANAAASGASADAGSTEPRTIQQAPLAQSDNSVIIRRGDTLWQISRRVYGQGVRYTTIYLANSKEITNPDFIEPGQIFTVPKDALPNAEEIHRKRLQDKAVN